MVWLGLRSYAIYLFHQPVGSMAHHLFNGSVAPEYTNLTESWVIMLSLVIVFIFAEISYRYFESVFLAFGGKIVYKNSQINPQKRAVCQNL